MRGESLSGESGAGIVWEDEMDGMGEMGLGPGEVIASGKRGYLIGEEREIGIEIEIEGMEVRCVA